MLMHSLDDIIRRVESFSLSTETKHSQVERALGSLGRF